MKFGIFLPADALDGSKLPVLYWLSGSLFFSVVSVVLCVDRQESVIRCNRGTGACHMM